MMKIAFLLSSYAGESLGGAELQAYYLARECLARGHETSYVYLAHHGKVGDGSGIRLVPIPRFGAVKRFGLGYSIYRKSVLAALDSIQPDMIYQRGGSALTGIAAEYCRTRGSCKLIWHIAGQTDVTPSQFEWDRSLIFRYVDKKLLEYGIKNASYIIGQAAYQDELLQENYGRGCDLIVPNFHPVPKHEIRKEDPVRVIWVANLKSLKQPEIFIHLVTMLHHRRDVRFVMIGRPASGHWQTRLEKEMAKLSNLSYIGERPIDEVNQILTESHVLVNTSLYEGFPNTFIQAWFRRVPVVSLNVDPDDILKENGIGLHSRSLDGLARDTERLIDDRALRESMGEQAQQYALSHHSMGPNVTQMISVFSQVHQTSLP